MLIKEECVFSLAGLYSADDDNEHVEEYVETLKQLINEHFDNPPLNFDELEYVIDLLINELHTERSIQGYVFLENIIKKLQKQKEM